MRSKRASGSLRGRRRSSPAAMLLAVLLPAACAAGQQQVSVEQARDLLSTGQYEEALAALEGLDTDGADVSVRAARIDALLALGRYEEAAGLADDPERAGALVTRRAEALAELGDVEAGLAALDAVPPTGIPDRARALVLLGDLRWSRGQREQAREAYDALIDFYNGADRLDPADLVAVGDGVRALGRWESVYFHDAVKAYDEALAADPENAEARLAMATLFLDKYDSGEAKSLLGPLLERNPRHPEALAALARVHHFDGSGEAETRAREALDVNPALVEAHVLLARMALESGDESAAHAAIDAALEQTPERIEPLALRAATHWLEGDEARFREAEARVLALDPHHAALYTVLADLAAQRRLYADAAALAERGIAADSLAWESWGHRGLNLMRVGAIDEGRAALESAFEGDPFNVWFKNTLDLLDTFENYRVVPTEHFVLVLHEREADVLAPYFADVAERAFAALVERYGIVPPHPIRLEVFPSHADFSVRTVGLAGIGALGVSFGTVLAMDSPSARARGEFNWASTLWHEVAHSFHMALSDNRVPRWLTEGLAVFEQRRHAAGWGFAPSPAFLEAIREGQLRPLSRLNEGFVRPRAPQEVPFSYLLASLATEYIEATHGFEATLALLEGYGQGRDTEELLESVMGMDAAELDERFDDYLQERFAGPLDATRARRSREAADLAAPGDFRGQLIAGETALESGDAAGAREHFERAHELFPNYGGPDSPLWGLMRVGRAEDDLDAVIRWGEILLDVQESHLDGAYALVEAYRERGDRNGELAAWTRVLEVAPLEAAPHERMADLHEEAGDFAAAARAWAGVVALDPADPVEARYRLARARFQSGDVDGARSAVLEALETAPTYGPALELLLQIRGGDA